MQIFKSVTTRANKFTPFEVFTYFENDKTYAMVEPRSVIYRSFNLKDMMIATGFLDNDTRAVIEGFEKTISGHVINGLGDKIELKADKEYHIIYLEVGIGPNLYATGAEIKIGYLDNPWSGYPEPFVYSQGIEFDDKGNLKSPVIYRRQTAAIFPLAYLTNDGNQIGKTVSIPKSKEDKDPKTYKLVQTIDYNIMMTTFNYDGNPVAYGIPFMNPFFYYSSSSTSS
jgi:hypothetical protein